MSRLELVAGSQAQESGLLAFATLSSTRAGSHGGVTQEALLTEDMRRIRAAWTDEDVEIAMHHTNATGPDGRPIPDSSAWQITFRHTVIPISAIDHCPYVNVHHGDNPYGPGADTAGDKVRMGKDTGRELVQCRNE